MAELVIPIPPDVAEYLDSLFRDEAARPLRAPPGAFTVDEALEIARRVNPEANRSQVYQTLERETSRGKLCKALIPKRERAGRRVINHAYYWRPEGETGERGEQPAGG